ESGAVAVESVGAGAGEATTNVQVDGFADGKNVLYPVRAFGNLVGGGTLPDTNGQHGIAKRDDVRCVGFGGGPELRRRDAHGIAEGAGVERYVAAEIGEVEGAAGVTRHRLGPEALARAGHADEGNGQLFAVEAERVVDLLRRDQRAGRDQRHGADQGQDTTEDLPGASDWARIG